MSAAGFKKANATGRSDGRIKQHSRSKIEGPFIVHTRDLLESPAWGALKLVDRIVLDRLEIEHMAHAGTENGNLICTYSDLEAYGARRGSIPKALRRLEALGFIEIVERGRQARSEFRFPSRYRLTYVLGNLEPTNEWEQLKSAKDVERALAKLLKQKRKKSKKPGTKTAPKPDTVLLPNNPLAGSANATPVPGTKTSLLSISREDALKQVGNPEHDHPYPNPFQINLIRKTPSGE